MGTSLSRRSFAGLLGAGTAGAVLTGGPAFGSPSDPRKDEKKFRALGRKPKKKPNILVIIGDDLGASDLSSYGAPHIRTPHLDRLASQGLRFTQAYSGSSTCSPTRFSFYTGRYPGRLAGGLLEPINARGAGLPPEHPTLASLLKKEGYDTALIGKWHAGFLPDFSPTRSGWDVFFGNFGGGLDYFSKISTLGEYDLYEGDATHQDLRYYTDILTERAVDHIRADHDRPWLLNLNFTTPHWPWETRDDRKTSDRLTARIKAGENPTQVLRHSDGGSLEIYARMVESLDASIGKVLDALRRSGQEDDTVVLFSSDNGGERFSYNWPLTGAKSSLYEGGIRVPNILRWPGVIAPRQYSDLPVSSPDWTATLLAFGGAAPAPTHPLDGTNLAGHLLRGEKLPERDLFWRTRNYRALRRGDWKYFRGTSGNDQLFNLAVDEREQHDHATAEPGILADLKASWEKTDATLLPYA